MIVNSILEWIDTLLQKYDFLLADERRLISPGILNELARHGLFGLQIDTKYGGLNLSYTDTITILEKLATVNLTIATIVSTHMNGVYAIQHYGSDKLKEEYLPSLANGNGMAAFALTEEYAGSYVYGIKSLACQLDNNKWTINGRKIWVDSGSWSSIVVTFCKTLEDGQQPKFIAFAVPAHIPGVVIGNDSYTMGLRAMVQSQIDFDNTIISEDYLLGNSRDGLLIANTTLDKSRLLLSAKSLGASKRCLQLLISYAKNRTISTGVLFDNPVLSKTIGDISLGITALEACCKELAFLLDNGHDIPAEIFMMVKIFGSELINQTADSTLQFLGGRGYMEQNIVPQILRDARSLKISEGANESLNSHIGSVLTYSGDAIYDFLSLKLNSVEQSNQLKELCKIVYSNYISTGVVNENNTLEYWAHYLIGKLSTYHLLISIVKYSTSIDSSTKKLVIQHLDLACEFILSQSGKTSSSILLLGSIDSIRNIAYRQITPVCELNSTLSGLDNRPDEYLFHKFNRLHSHSILHGTVKEYSYDRSNIVDVVMYRFAEYGDKVAATCMNENITYNELVDQVNSVVHLLTLNGIKAGDIVGVYINNSIPLIVNLLGVLKVGAVYIPLDPAYPIKRLEYIIHDSQITTIITTIDLEDLIKPIIPVVITIPDILHEQTESDITSCEAVKLAYVIYTSGSTGAPKGVRIEHAAVINFLLSMEELLLLSPENVFMLHTTISFDIAVLELFLPLMIGSKIAIVPRNVLYDGQALIKYMDEQQVSVIQATPSLWHMLFEYGWHGHAGLTVLSGGETLYPSLAQKLLVSSKHLWNMYGPTEATVWTTAYLVEQITDGSSVAIGKPLNNVSIYILNEDNAIVNLGEVGEICIAGKGLAEGYMNRDDLTAEKFILLNTGNNVFTKVYKTGDLGRIDNNEMLICLGRKDRQVKLNGYRIELGEIEHVLLLHDFITATAVVKDVDEDNLAMLIAYYVGSDNCDESELRNYLKQYLPSYMIPYMYIKLDKLPLTQNGKIDYNALPKPVYNVTTANNISVSDLCAAIISIWQILFKRKDITNQSNFFELGGNSLFALKMIATIREQLECNVTIADLFLNSTVDELVVFIENSKELRESNKNNITLIHKQNFADVVEQRLSFAQERLWFIDQYEGGTNVYNNALCFEIIDSVNIEILEQALRRTVLRHDVLYSFIRITPDGQPYQIVGDITQQPLYIEYKSVFSESELNDSMNAEMQHIFNLASEYPLRITIYSLLARKYLGIVVHHIAFDGWSTDIFLRDLYHYYNFCFGQSLGKTAKLYLPEIPIHYKDFAVWQRSYLSGYRLEKQLLYWLTKLSDFEQLNLATDKPRPLQVSYAGDTVYFTIDASISNMLRDFAKNLKVSLFSLLLSNYYLLLRSYTNQDDIVVGTLIANRHYPQLEDMVGVFVNSLALRSQINSEQKLCDYIQSISSNVIDAQLHQDLPFEQLVEKLHIIPDTSRHPLFQVAFGMQSFGTNLPTQSTHEGLFLDLLKLYNTTIADKIAKFDITLTIDDSQTELRCTLNYATSLFNYKTAEQISCTYKYLLEQLAVLNADSLKQIKDLSYLNAENYTKVVRVWNQTLQDYPTDKTIHQLFEEQVQNTPDNIAVVYEDTRLTYTELNQRANQLAHYLKNTYNIQGDDLIALCLERSEYMLIAILGVLKSGAAYVPIDPRYPDERIAYILEDTQAKIVLINEMSEERLSGVDTLIIDSSKFQLILLDMLVLNPESSITSSNLAYVIYTSGTSGKPKGVMVEHTSVVNLIAAQANAFELTMNGEQNVVPKNCISYANYVFDAHVSEIFTAISYGHQLHILNNDIRHDLELLAQYIKSNNIYIGTIPPVLLDMDTILKLKILVVAGDTTNSLIMECYHKKGIRVINAYGPTEATVCTTINQYKFGESNICIGTPIHNTKVYVLDIMLQPLPIGAIGELYIGGIGLARGYLNQPKLTAERFITNPFQNTEEMAHGINTILYKTGDLVRFLPDGNLEYRGRSDFQVKLRGNRVELSEIETVLNTHQQVKSSAVQLYETANDASIIAYYIPKRYDHQISWWPSIAEYYVYDELLYSLMTGHVTRNECYRLAIRQVVKDKVVLDIGTGPDVILSRICVEEGAKKVYAIEYLQETYNKALQTIKAHHLEDRINLILGDSRKVVLPEQCDVCVSEIVGAIGGSEGAAVILNDAKARHVKPDGIFIPECSLTNIAAVILPEEMLINPYLDRVQYDYTQKIYAQTGYKFDLRLCLKDITYNDLASDLGVFEELTWQGTSYAPINHEHKIHLTISRSGRIHGFLVWLNLVVSQDNCVDILSDQQSWLPIYLPAFPHGVDVSMGDYIDASVERILCENGLNFDYVVSGHVYCGSDTLAFYYNSIHNKAVYKHNEFYIRFFDMYDNYNAYNLESLDEFLGKYLPSYMVPSSFIELKEFPVTNNGKLDRKALPDPDFTNTNTDDYVVPRNELEIQLISIWSEILNIPASEIGVKQSFFKLGGNSILLVKFKRKLAAINSCKNLTLADLFKYHTIDKLVSSIYYNKIPDIKLLQPSLSVSNDIAIIATSGAFSGVQTIEELWDLISQQKEGIKTYTIEQCRELGVSEELLQNPDYVPVSGHVVDIDMFDPAFWHMSGIEAKQTDPQIRKFLEVCYYVLEQSGYLKQRKELNIGVFAGNGNNDYFYNNVINGELKEKVNYWEASILNNKDALATKISYLLELTGPANSINTACSTGLVTVVEACKNLAWGICDLALAGGVSLALPDKIGYIYKEGLVLSRDGHCRTFDEKSSGTASGSGVGVVLLKRLTDAIKDNDNIIAVIKGYATNNDGGRKVGYTAPSVIGQTECILHAQRMAGISSNEIDYVECHGTATNLGDPIEVQALKEAFILNSHPIGSTTSSCILGSVKANIGHADSAAGIAGLLKVCSMFEHELIPGQMNFDQINPELNLESTNFKIITENQSWQPIPDRVRIAAVSSFGIGGTNAHVIVSEYVKDVGTSSISNTNLNVDTKVILPLSANSRNSLERYKQEFIKYLRNNDVNLNNIAYTLQQNREHFSYRTAITANNIEQALRKLNDSLSMVQINDSMKADAIKLVFMFPGQGSQYQGMALDLYSSDLRFKLIMDQCINIANQYLTENLAIVLYPTLYPKKSVMADINQTEWAQISLFVLSYSLAKWLNELGVHADSYIGHSIGEYVAATMADVFSLDDAIKLVIARGRLMQKMQPGSMLSISAQLEEIELEVIAAKCEIAVVNSENNYVISGTKDDIKQLKHKLDLKAISSIILNTSHAYHSYLMEQAAIDFKAEFDRINLHKPTKPFISNLSGEYVTDYEVMQASYWCKQLRNCVQFAKGVATLCKHYANNLAFIEVGAGKGLSSFIASYQDNIKNAIKSVQLLPSKVEFESGNYTRLTTKEDIGAVLWLHGLEDNLDKYNKLIAKVVYDLPRYQFDWKTYWIRKAHLKHDDNRLEINASNEMFYVRRWLRNEKFVIQSSQHIDKINILLFSNEVVTQRIDDLVKNLRREVKSVVYVKNITSEFRSNDLDIEMDFSSLDHMINVVDFLQQNMINNVTTVYIASGLGCSEAYADVAAITNLKQILYANSMPEHRFISISYNNFEILGNEHLDLTPSMLYGLSRSLRVENPKIKSIHFDLEDSASYNLVDLIQYSYASDLIAIRNGYIWTPIYNKVTLDVSQDFFVNNGNTILITGGLGGIGYSFARYVSKNFSDLNLILMGRSAEDELKLEYVRRLSDIRSLGQNVIYIPFDIGSNNIETLLNTLTYNNITRINCVLHTAGVSARSALEIKSLADIKAVVLPKVVGTLNLINLAKQIPFDHLINCSSLSSILPSYGNLEYSAANIFMDEISYRKYDSIAKIITINFNAIADIGMTVDFIRQTNEANYTMNKNSIQSNEIPEILNNIAKVYSYGNVLISRLDISNQLKQLDEEYHGVKLDPINSIKILEDNYTELEYEVAQVFCDVLGIDEISLYDDFMQLGGNSILALRVINRLNESIGLNISIVDLLKYKNITDLLNNMPNTDNDSTIIIPKLILNEVDLVNGTPLSFAQERLWFIEQYEGGTNAYNLSLINELDERTNLAILEQALKATVSRHEVLHSLFRVDEAGNNYQLVCNLDERPLNIDQFKLVTEDKIDVLIAAEINYVFQLTTEYPIKISLFEVIGLGKYLSVIIHHIAFDGWSLNVFKHDLQAYYDFYLEQSNGSNAKLSIPELSIQYKDFAYWQKSFLVGKHLDNLLNYWKSKLDGFISLNLPIDKPRPIQISYAGDNSYFVIEHVTSFKLRELAKSLRVSLYSVLLSGFNLLLRCYSNQDDVIIGTTIANRQHYQLENLVGFFVNTLAFRSQIDPNNSITDYIYEISQQILEAQLYQDLPFEKLVQELNLSKDTSRHPIFQVMFGVQSFNNPAQTMLSAQDTGVTNVLKPYPRNISYNVAQFDLTVLIDDGQEMLKGSFNYATSLFNRSTIEQMSRTYLYLLEQISNISITNTKKIQDLRYLNQQDYIKIITTWNQTTKKYPSNVTMHKQFENQVVKTPNNIALIYQGIQLTYKELNQKANQLAHYLRDTYHTQYNDLVVLFLDRSELMLITILAILKSGAAYVPIDPNYPDERIEYILEDTKAKILLTNEVYEPKLMTLINSKQIQLLSIDSYDIQTKLNFQPIVNFKKKDHDNNLAYVIYTSGTTGKPKGVMIEHKSFVALIHSMHERSFTSVQTLCTYSMTNYVFDIFALEYGLSLLSGGSVTIGSNDFSLLDCSCYTFIQMTPSLCGLKFDNLINVQNTTLIIGGEVLSPKLLHHIIDRNICLINVYGPTETTIWSTSMLYTTTYDNANLSIGKPLANETCYVLDNNLQPLPVGAVGELYIGGVGLARGYWNQSELTKERFIANPFQSETEQQENINTRIYKTGDLVRYLPDGSIEYISRNDFQVKIRGFRIELGDIEAAICSYSGIKQSVVLVKEYKTNLSGNMHNNINSVSSNISQYLVAYYVSSLALDEDLILKHISNKLPEYMLPNVLVHLNTLPLTSNGKVDRKSLPMPEFSSINNYVAPSTELEHKVCLIYAEVLGLDLSVVGMQDDFFRLGGNSILAIKLVSRLNHQIFNASNKLNPQSLSSDITTISSLAMPVKISIAGIFKYRTIAALLNSTLSESKSNQVLIPRISYSAKDHASGASRCSSLSFAQERLWFIENYERGTNAYNIPLIHRLADDVDTTLLGQALKATVLRHEVLHSFIKTNNEGSGYQEVGDLTKQPLHITVKAVTNKTDLANQVSNEINRVFNLAQEYPILANIFKLKSGLNAPSTTEESKLDESNISDKLEDTSSANKSKLDRYLVIVIHHIAFDGWSIEVFLNDLNAYYRYYKQLNQDSDTVEVIQNLPELSIQYRDFAVWQRGYLSGAILEQQLSYWKDKLSDYENLNLITDKQRPNQIDYTGDMVYFNLDAATSTKLRELAKQLQVSLYSVLLSGFNLLLRSYANQDDLVVGTPVSNRHHEQLEHLVGFFVNSLALRSKIDSEATLIDYIQVTGKEVIEAQLHQDLPFEKLVEELNVAQDQSRHPIFQVMFGVQSFTYKEDGNNLFCSDEHDQLLDDLYAQYRVAKFDLTVMLEDSKTEISGIFNYATSLYVKDTIKGYIQTYKHILHQLAELSQNKLKQSQMIIKELNYLNQTNYQKIIYDWNKTEKDYPSDKTIHQLFEEQVQRTPDNIAVVYEDTKLTYQEFNQRANQLAYYLRTTYHIQGDDLIALCLDRSEYMLIAILATLKSGAAYVPIDPSYPDERIEYILKDIQTKVLLTNDVYVTKFTELTLLPIQNNDEIPTISSNQSLLSVTKNIVTIHAIDSAEFQAILAKYDSSNLHVNITSINLAYVIYTSGTTGKPKGVMITHSSVINYVENIKELGLISDKDIVGFSTNFSFDLTVTTTLSSLCIGAKVAVYSGLVQDIEIYVAYLLKHQVTVIKLVPSYFKLLIENLSKTLIKKIILGGEKLSGNVLNKLYIAYKDYSFLPEVYDEYGPTETTVGACISKVTSKQNLNIGKSYANYTTYILSNNLYPLPLGAIGELYIGGAGLARGYLNNPELTVERFIANPFQTDEEKQQGKNARLYKTGDLVRYLLDGNIEYIGRNDFQVKIRGFRIELGEIESLMLKHNPEIKQVVGLVREHLDREGNGTENKYLALYYVAASELDNANILSSLSQHLPEYMVPNVCVWLEQLPLTINGKLDRKALPDPEFISTDNHVIPRNDLEAEVRTIFAEVLGLSADKLSITDSFFRLGGDSISSIQVVSKLRQKLGLSVNVKDVFNYKSVINLFDNVISKLSNLLQIEQLSEHGILVGDVQLLPIQEWFWEKVNDNIYLKHNHWNQSFLIKVNQLDIELLKLSIIKLIEYHDSFRLAYLINEKSSRSSVASYVKQYYASNSVIPELNMLDIGDLGDDIEVTKTLTRWQSALNLESGHAYSIGYLYGYEDGSARIFFALHHLLVDAVSWRIITSDLKELYSKLEFAKQDNTLSVVANQSSETLLGSKGTSYRQWVSVVKSHYAIHNVSELNYWQHTVMYDYITTSKIALARLIENELSNNYVEMSLDLNYTDKLLTKCNQIYDTNIEDLLLTALTYALYELTGSNIQHILLEGHGREEIDSQVDITRTVGWFTIMYPVRFELCKPDQKMSRFIISDNIEDELCRAIKRVKSTLRAIPNDGMGYGVLIGYAKENLPLISFNYLGQFNQNSADGIWDIIGEPSGCNIDTVNRDINVININGLVINNMLSFNLAGKLSQANMDKLGRLFRKNLKKVIEYATDEKVIRLANNNIVMFPSQLRYLESESTYYNYYNSFFAIKTHDIDLARFKQIFNEVKQKYDVFNAVFIKNSDDSWYLTFNKSNQGNDGFEVINVVDEELNESRIQDIINGFHQKISIEHGKCMIAGVIRTKSTNIFFIIINHLIMDRFSLDLILDELSAIYSGTTKVDLSTQAVVNYKDVLTACNNYLNYNNLEVVQTYWEKLYECKDIVPVDNNIVFSASDLKNTDNIMIFSKDEYIAIKDKLTHDDGNLFYSLLIYGVYQALCRTFSIEDFVLNTIHNGRNSEFYSIDTNTIVGWMSCTIPIRLNIQHVDTLIQGIYKVNEVMLEAPGYGLSHGILKYANNEPNLLKTLDKINVEFNFQGNMTQGNSTSIFDFEHVICGGLNRHNNSTPEYALYLTGYQDGNGVYLGVTYSSKSYYDTTINKLRKEFVQFFNQVKQALLNDTKQPL